MGKDTVKKPNQNWHIYSMITIVGMTTFFSVNLWSGDAETIGVAFSAILLFGLSVLPGWKELPSETHQWFFYIAVFLVVGYSLIKYLTSKR